MCDAKVSQFSCAVVSFREFPKDVLRRVIGGSSTRSVRLWKGTSRKMLGDLDA